MTDKILVLAANPQDTVQLLLNREIWEIDNALESGKYREQFSFRSKVAFRVDDLQSSFDTVSENLKSCKSVFCVFEALAFAAYPRLLW